MTVYIKSAPIVPCRSLRPDSRYAIRSVAAAILLLTLAGFQPETFASSATGFTGRTNKSGGSGCTTCHGSVADSAISTVISGSSTLAAGASSTYTVTATKSGVANGVRMGINVAASDSGTPLSVINGQPTALDAGTSEIVHSTVGGTVALKTIANNLSQSYTFTYTMPANAAAGSTHTLYAVAVLGYAGGWKHATNFTVTVPTPIPVISSGSTASGTVGVLFNYQIGATNTPTGYGVTGTLPTNVTINTNSGLISGTPSNSGTFNINVTASNGGGTSSPQPVTITIAPAVVAATRFVNAATGSNTSNTCSVLGSPCKTITYAMTQALAGNPGDLISVAPGTYNLSLGEVFPIIFKSGVQLVATGSPADTFIDAVGDTVKQAVLTSTSNTSASSRLEGFTIKNGRGTTGQGGSALGGAVIVNYSSALFTITRNIFSGNQITGYTANGLGGETGGLAWGGAIYGFNSTVEISNNIFTNNIAQGGDGFSDFSTPATNKNAGQGQGGAIYISGSGKIINNTFYDNNAQGGGGGYGGSGSRGVGGDSAGGAVLTYTGFTVSNNIFSTNRSLGGSGSTAGIASAGALSGGGATITNNLFFGNIISGAAGGAADTTGTSALTSNPLFVLAPTNLQITSASPAKAAGTATGAPIKDFAGTTRPSPPAIGAYEPAAAVPSTNPKLNPIYYLLLD